MIGRIGDEQRAIRSDSHAAWSAHSILTRAQLTELREQAAARGQLLHYRVARIDHVHVASAVEGHARGHVSSADEHAPGADEEQSRAQQRQHRPRSMWRNAASHKYA